MHERYRWDVSAERLAEVYEDLLRRPALARSPRVQKRLAISSPAPPNNSGPSFYLGLLLDELVELCEVTLFTAEADELTQVHRRVRVETLSELELIDAIEGEFDEVLCFLENCELHFTQQLAQRIRPGCAFLHDPRFVGLYRPMTSLSGAPSPFSRCCRVGRTGLLVSPGDSFSPPVSRPSPF